MTYKHNLQNQIEYDIYYYDVTLMIVHYADL